MPHASRKLTWFELLTLFNALTCLALAIGDAAQAKYESSVGWLSAFSGWSVVAMKEHMDRHGAQPHP